MFPVIRALAPTLLLAVALLQLVKHDELYLLLKKQPQGKPELGLQAISLQQVTIFN